MKTVRYIGISGIREISAADFRSVDVEVQNKIRVRGRNLSESHPDYSRLSETVEVEDDAAEWLVANDDFELDGEVDPEASADVPNFETAHYNTLKAYARKIGMDMSETGINQTREQLVAAIKEHQASLPS